MDLSSEMIHALLPLYLVTVLGASMLTVGMIEGVAASRSDPAMARPGRWPSYRRTICGR